MLNREKWQKNRFFSLAMGQVEVKIAENKQIAVSPDDIIGW